MRGSGDLIWGPPHLFEVLLVPLTQKHGSQPHNSPRLRCYNIKRTQKLHAMCWNRQIFVSIRVDVEIVKTVETKIWKKSLTYSLCDNLKTIDASASKNDICQINLGQIFASYNISHSLLQQIFVLQHFSVVVTTNIWFSHCYNLFALLQGLCVVTILLQRIHVVTILIQHIACNCYNLFDKHCNNGIFWLLQALQTPIKRLLMAAFTD